MPDESELALTVMRLHGSLYDAGTGRELTILDLYGWVIVGIPFVVLGSSGEDLTSLVLEIPASEGGNGPGTVIPFAPRP